MFDFDANDPTIGQAFAQLDSESAADAQTSPGHAEPTPASSTEAQPEPAQAEATGKETTSPEQGTQATEESTANTDPQGKTTSETDGKSRYEKNRIRLEGSWQKLNEEKAAFRSQSEALQRERQALERERHQFVQQQAKTKQPAIPPERYEQHAGQLEARAEQARREAERLEIQGLTDAAEAKREQMYADRVNARKAREYANQIRENPPKPDPTDAEVTAKFAEGQKQWWGKAIVDFPVMQKPDSEEYKTMAAAITPGNPNFNPIAHAFVESHPEAMYHLAQFSVLKSSAARVPAMQKELETLRAKVKDYETKLSPNAEHLHGKQLGPKDFKEMSEAEQYAQLEQQARSMDAAGY